MESPGGGELLPGERDARCSQRWPWDAREPTAMWAAYSCLQSQSPEARILGAWGLQLCPFGHRPGPWVPGWLRREPRGLGCWTQRPLGRPAKLWEQRPKKDDFGDRVRTSGLGAEAGGQRGATRVLPSGCPLPGEQGIEGHGLPAAGQPLCKTWAPLVPVTHTDRRQQAKCPLPRQTPVESAEAEPGTAGVAARPVNLRPSGNVCSVRTAL